MKASSVFYRTSGKNLYEYNFTSHQGCDRPENFGPDNFWSPTINIGTLPATCTLENTQHLETGVSNKNEIVL